MKTYRFFTMFSTLILMSIILITLSACAADQPSIAIETSAVVNSTATPNPPTKTLPHPTATQIPPTETATPTPEPSPPEKPTLTPTKRAQVVFRLHESAIGSALPLSKLAIFNGPNTDPGGVVYHEGQFHMFYNNLQDFPPTELAIGYATSPDGINWTRITDFSILDGTDVPYVDNVIRAASVLVEDDGTWVLYFDTMASTESAPYSVVGRATANSPIGPWAVDPNPVLAPDEGGWDEYAIQRPCIIKTEAGYFMYFQAFASRWDAATFGLATSSDGINWIKHDTPIFDGSEVTWGQHIAVRYPYVVKNEQGWFMFFKATGDKYPNSIGIAVSDNGVDWVLGQHLPVFETAKYAAWNSVFVDKVIQIDQTWFLFLELENFVVSKVLVATFTGELIPGKNLAPVAAEP